MDLSFYWVDVFAHEALTGNPLPLIPDASQLTVDTMRAITKEFNQSETTFLVKPSRTGADYSLRSFTPGGVEVLGAGHNAMGAWIWLASSGLLPAHRSDFSQQIGEEVLPVRIDRTGPRAVVTMRQSPPVFVKKVEDREALTAALDLVSGEIAPFGAAEVVSTGAEHLLVRLNSREAVDHALPDSPELKRLLALHGAEGCYVYSIEDHGDGIDAYARFFNPTVGIAEDPATGTAAGPLSAVLDRDGHIKQGASVTIEQGRILGRRSLLRLSVTDDRVELSGSGLLVAEGTLHL